MYAVCANWPRPRQWDTVTNATYVAGQIVGESLTKRCLTLYHGTKHPYNPGEELVSGGIVSPCFLNEEAEPSPGCGCGCDGRMMVWATTDLTEATHAAMNRVCTCGDGSVDHRPRVFEVVLEGMVEDPNAYTANSVMASRGIIEREIRPLADS